MVADVKSGKKKKTNAKSDFMNLIASRKAKGKDPVFVIKDFVLGFKMGEGAFAHVTRA